MNTKNKYNNVNNLPQGGDFKKHFKALSFGEGWVRPLASYLAIMYFSSNFN